MSRREYLTLWTLAVAGVIGCWLLYVRAEKTDEYAGYLRVKLVELQDEVAAQRGEIASLKRRLPER